MIDLAHVSPTRWLGLIGFGLAALSCGWASLRRPTPWRALTVVQALFLVEIVVGARHRLHNAADAILQAHHVYAQREPLQVGLLMALTLLLLIGAFAVLAHARRLGRFGALGIAASGAGGALLLVEIVSLHAIDQVMDARIEGVLVIGIGWAVTGGLVAVCALFDRRA